MLIRGLSEDEKKIVLNQLLNSIVLERLREFLEVKKRELIIRQKDYDNPAWMAKQAHQNGLYEAYTQIENLITLDQKD